MVRRSLRVALLTLTLLLLMTVPARPGMGRSASPAAIAFISPPEGVSVPIGQGLEVRYAALSTMDRLTVELWYEDELLAVDRVVPGASREVEKGSARYWAPRLIGPNELSVRAYDEQGALIASARLVVIGLSQGSMVLLRGETRDIRKGEIP